ncbi:MAG TPA: MOSC domain-containing protein [Polyangia bacterium]
MPKTPVLFAHVDARGVTGDRQANLVHHGGPDRAVCLFALERIEALRAEGHPIVPGAIGENLTIRGLDWNVIAPGVRLRVGNELELEVTSFAAPCKTIRGALANGHFNRLSQKQHPGWSRVYARVLVEGEIQPGDRITVVETPSP